MADMQNAVYIPTIEEIRDYIGNDLFDKFRVKMEEDFKANCKIEYSKCSWEHGWNVKYKKRGKNLCTVYPRENYFTVLVVIGGKEKENVETILPELSTEIQTRYHQTQEGNGQRWLMIDLEDDGERYEGALELIKIRSF